MSMTVLESFDAQMLDYPGDNDIPMYTAGSTSESSGWPIPIEANMDDDSQTPTLDSHSTRSETVEVDMDSHIEEDITEYEMTDDVDGSGEMLHDGDEEIPDVEVFDAPEAVSYTGSSVLDDVQPAPSEAPDRYVEPFEPSTPPAAEAPASFVESHTEVIETISPDALLHRYYPGSEEYDPSHTDFSSAPLVSSSEPGATSDVATSTQVLPVNEIVESAHVTYEHGAIDSNVLELFAPPATEDGVTHVQDVSEAQVEVQEASPEGIPADHFPAEESHEWTEHHQDAEGEDQQEYQETQEHTSNADPHEILEGVYIDPPPAVLLSLSTSTEEFEYTLFNQYPSASAAESPDVGTSADASRAGTAVLLHDRPTLYYEPLNQVFEALRQEEAVYNVPELADGELFLDAYDLQLPISEDNTWTHHVTLHDLNVLHDGSDLQGPLRIRLYGSSPRFITRYNALREQIDRLHLATDIEETYDDHVVTNTAALTEDVHEYSNEEQSGQAEIETIYENEPEGNDVATADIQDGESKSTTDISSRKEDVSQEGASEHNPITVSDGHEVYENGTDLDEEGRVQEPVNNESEVEVAVGEATEVNKPNSVQEESEHNEWADAEGEDEDYGEDFTEEPESYESTSEEAAVSDEPIGLPAASELQFEQQNDSEEQNAQDESADGDQAHENTRDYDVDKTADFEDNRGIEESEVQESNSVHQHTETTIHVSTTEAVPESRDNNELATSSHIQDLKASEGPEIEEFYEYDDDIPLEAIANPGEQGLHKQKSTETLASKTSKRSYDQVEPDELDDSFGVSPPSSPDSKRLKMA